MRALEVALGQPQARPRVAQADLPARRAQRAVEPVLGEQLARLLELPALDQRVEQQHERRRR